MRELRSCCRAVFLLPMTQAEVDTLLAQSAGVAQRIKVDDQEMERHRLAELVTYAKFAAGERASARGFGGVQFAKLRPCGGGGN